MSCIPSLCSRVMKIDTLEKRDLEALSSCGSALFDLFISRKKKHFPSTFEQSTCGQKIPFCCEKDVQYYLMSYLIEYSSTEIAYMRG